MEFVKRRQNLKNELYKFRTSLNIKIIATATLDCCGIAVILSSPSSTCTLYKSQESKGSGPSTAESTHYGALRQKRLKPHFPHSLCIMCLATSEYTLGAKYRLNEKHCILLADIKTTSTAWA